MSSTYPTGPPASLRRDRTVDIARGISIVLIVLSHVIVGVWQSDAIETGAKGPLMPALYLVHIVVFAVLAGLFVERGVSRRGAARYLAERGALFVWLYVLWTLLQRGSRVLGGPFASTAASPVELLRLWRPEGQLWFLPWLLAATVLVALVHPWRSRRRGLALLGATAALALVVWGWEPNAVVVQGLALTPFFVAGVLVRGDRVVDLVSGSTVLRLGVVALAAGVVYLGVVAVGNFAMPTAASPDRSAIPLVWGVLGSTSGLVLVLAVSALLARLPGLGWLAFVGQRSMEIYLAHILVGVLVRAVLVDEGVQTDGAHLVVGTAVGVLAPLGIWWLAGRARMGWLFALPAPLQRRLRAV